MKLGLRLLFAFFVINGLAAFFILRVFTAEIKPSARQVMEDLLVDTAYILAELASQDLAAGQMTTGQFAQQVSRYATRRVNASIWGMRKQSLDYRIYVTDQKGIVVFDSENRALGQDYSNWRDVALTLRGEYGARATREVANDERTGVMYVAAPVLAEGQLIGVLAVAKPARTVQVFIDRAERKIFLRGLLLLALSAAVGIAVTCWLVWNIRKLRHYALNAEAGHKLAAPRVPGEFGDLAAALETMRARLEGRDYVEAYVQALTHELKSPVAAIRGAGELLLDDLPPADRGIFAQQIVEQTQRVQRLIERLLDLSKLEQRQALAVQTPINLSSCTHAAIAHIRDRATQKNTRIDCTGVAADGLWEAELVTMAVSNLLENAVDFSPSNSTIEVRLNGLHIVVQDYGAGVPDYALPRLGERFFSTPRPNGKRTGSGLGLAIVKQVMELHGGALILANTHPGWRAELIFASSASK